MRLPLAPYGTDSHGGMVEWLRTLATAVAAGFRVEHTAEGRHDWHWVDRPYAAGLFTGSGDMTWTVDPADLVQYRYGLLGDLMVFAFNVGSSDVGGTASFELRVALPLGYRANGDWTGALLVSDAGTFHAGAIRVATGDRFVRCTKGDVTVWTLTTSDNTSVFGTVTLRVTKD